MTQTEQREVKERRPSERDALLRAHFNSLCKPDRRLLLKLWAWIVEMTNWLRWVTEFVPDV